MENIDDLIKKQDEYFKSGKTLDIKFRIDMLNKLYSAVEKDEEKLAEAVYMDFKKPIRETFITEIEPIKSEIKSMIKNIKKWSRVEKTGMDMINPFSKNRIYKQPYGKVLIISPWNYPIQLSIIPLIGSIAAGNCSIVKMSEYAPNTAKVVKRIIEKIYKPEFVSVFYGESDESEKLLNSDVDYIFFTGSPQIGALVAESAGKRLIPYTLELGGKSPCIIDETADISSAARKIIWGKLINSGQTCVAPDYVIVEESVYSEFVKQCIKFINIFYGDNPIMSESYAGIINKRNFDRILKLIENENIICGGNYNSEILKIEPTIVDIENMDSEIMRQEIFGPILPVIKYKRKNEIYEIIDKNRNPLALYIFTTDVQFEENIIKNVSFGGGCVNDTIIHCTMNNMPFGGIGKSGIGSYHGKYSFETFSHKKSIVKSVSLSEIKLKYPPYTKEKSDKIRKMMKLARWK